MTSCRPSGESAMTPPKLRSPGSWTVKRVTAWSRGAELENMNPATTTATAATAHGSQRKDSRQCKCLGRVVVSSILDRDTRLADVAQAAPGVALEASPDHCSQGFWCIGRQRVEVDRVTKHRRQHMRDRLPFKDRAPNEHLPRARCRTTRCRFACRQFLRWPARATYTRPFQE